MAIETFSRREALKCMCGGIGMLGLADLLADDALAAGTHVVGPHFAPKAKHVILLFMTGGPSQVDLWDPKPALMTYAGQRPATADLRTERTTAGLMPTKFSFAKHGTGGIEMSELLPNLATVADELCVIRSMFTTNPNHEQARSMFHQGSMILSRPSMGSWISYGLGTENRNLPAFMVLAPDGGGFTTSGFLPAEFQGTSFNTFEMAPDRMIRFLRNTELGTDAQRAQLDLTQALNQKHQEGFGQDAFLEGRIASMESAFKMQFAAMDTLDVMKEPESVRDEYGSTPYAQGCLMARRLVESGVRFVVVHYGPGQPWDDHKEIDRNLRERCPNMDKASAALIRDLKRRGLLDDTLVVWGGEFGRTPVSESGDGRDHNPYGFSMFMAGGGVKGGMTYGASDDFGFRAVENRVSIHDLHATILHQLGIEPREADVSLCGQGLQAHRCVRECGERHTGLRVGGSREESGRVEKSRGVGRRDASLCECRVLVARGPGRLLCAGRITAHSGRLRETQTPHPRRKGRHVASAGRSQGLGHAGEPRRLQAARGRRREHAVLLHGPIGRLCRRCVRLD